MIHNYPYTNLHDLNLDWIIKQIETLDANTIQTIAEEVPKVLANLNTNNVNIVTSGDTSLRGDRVSVSSDKDITLHAPHVAIDEVLRYGQPQALSNYFKTVNAEDNTGTAYNILVATDNTNTLEPPNIQTITSSDDSLSVTLTNKQVDLKVNVTPDGVTPQYVQQQTAKALSDAKAYTDTAITSAKEEVKAYTDAEVLKVKNLIESANAELVNILGV